MTLLLVGCEHGLVGRDAGPGVAFEVVVEQPPGQGGLVVRVEPLVAGPSRRAGSDRELLGHLGPKPPHERLVDTRRRAHVVTASTVASWSRSERTARTNGVRRARRSGPVSSEPAPAASTGTEKAGVPAIAAAGVRGSVRTVADGHDARRSRGLSGLDAGDEPTGVLDPREVRAAGDEHPVPRPISGRAETLGHATYVDHGVGCRPARARGQPRPDGPARGQALDGIGGCDDDRAARRQGVGVAPDRGLVATVARRRRQRRQPGVGREAEARGQVPSGCVELDEQRRRVLSAPEASAHDDGQARASSRRASASPSR